MKIQLFLLPSAGMTRWRIMDKNYYAEEVEPCPCHLHCTVPSLLLALPFPVCHLLLSILLPYSLALHSSSSLRLFSPSSLSSFSLSLISMHSPFLLISLLRPFVFTLPCPSLFPIILLNILPFPPHTSASPHNIP